MLSPLDLQSKKIQPKRKKYEKAQMDEYLDLVFENYKELYTGYEGLKKENKELAKKIKTLSDGIQYYRSIESTMQKALVLAEKTSTETKDAALMKAEAIEKDASSRAEKIISDAEQEYNKIREKCITLIQQFNQYKNQLKQVAATQLELVTSESFEVDSPDLNETFEDFQHEHAPEDKNISALKAEDAVKSPKPEAPAAEETVILPNLKAKDSVTKQKSKERDTISILTADTIDLRTSIKKVQETEGQLSEPGIAEAENSLSEPGAVEAENSLSEPGTVEAENSLSEPEKADISNESLFFEPESTVLPEKKKTEDITEGITFVQDATVTKPVDAKMVEPLDARLNSAKNDELEILNPDTSSKNKNDTPTLDSLLQSMNMGSKKKKSKGQDDDPFEFLGSVDDF